MSSNIGQHGFINKLDITKNDAGEITRVNFLFNNGTKEFPSAVNTVSFNKAAQELAKLFEAGTKRFFLEGFASAPNFVQEGQQKIGRTNFVVNKGAASEPFVQGQENSQKEHGSTTGFIKTLNKVGENGVSGVISFAVGKKGEEKYHNVSFVAYGDRADFLKDILEKSEKARVTFDHTFLAGNVKRAENDNEKDKIFPAQLRVDNIILTHVLGQDGKFVESNKTLAQFRAENKVEAAKNPEEVPAPSDLENTDAPEVDFDDWDTGMAM